ncbi:hydantoinase/oxoprolinase family protein [Candidatus Bathyarchaeota archaeon]|nr:hydantoinase/oxoprolinase family protein [Candidatus Bathyarchaeota archaeon]
MTKYRVAIDIGGTFTDLVALNDATGELLNIKVSSTPKEPEEAVIKAFQEFLKKTDDPEASVILHATTIATNALLGQLNLELPRTALITTEGFRDILEIGRQSRRELYNLFVQRPSPLVPRRLRFEVSERIGPKGKVLKRVSRKEVNRLFKLLRKEEVRSVAVALLFSHINPLHERQVGQILRKSLPETHVSLSSEIAPEYREYERTSTTVVNAVLTPIVSNYLDALLMKIRKLKIEAPLCIMKSDGGIATKTIMSNKPVSMVESGPAAGVIASSFYGTRLGLENVLSFDMGGTTAKAGAIKQGTPEVVTEYEVAGEVHKGRIIRGSGYPVRYPFIDLAECSAGGGTIAWVDEGQALRVGPISAGADPGPACYNKGGEKPTITDANLILGRLNPKHILGGKMKIYPRLSEKAIAEEICSKISLEVIEAASGIVAIANSIMAKILRIVSAERGHDPRSFALICFGGAGPMHACELAEELGIEKIVVPYSPGLFSAYGLLTADFRKNLTKAIVKLIDKVNVQTVESKFQKLEQLGIEILVNQQVSRTNMKLVRQMDLRYKGQSYELTVPTDNPLTRRNLQQTTRRFHLKHKSIYGYAVQSEPVELVNIRLIATGLVEKPKFKKMPFHQKRPTRRATITKRPVFFEQAGDYLDTPIYSRGELKAGNVVEGPAVIEQYDATIVVHPEWTASVDGFLNIVISAATREGRNR